MAKKTVHGIDITAPGGIEALLAFHYLTFGDAVMLADDDDEDSDDDEQDDDEDEDTGEKTGGDDDSDDDDEEDPDGSDELGDPGKKALRIMKDKLKAAKKGEREAKAELQRSKSAQGKTKEQLEAEEERQKRDAAVIERANERILRSEVKAAAAGKLANPSLAARLLDLSEFEVDEDGNVDEDEIAEAIDDLLEREPYLAAQRGGSSTQFDSARGKRKATKKYTQKDLESMSPAEIAKAYDDGKVKL